MGSLFEIQKPDAPNIDGLRLRSELYFGRGA